jgi:hypothetical protein
LAEEQAQGVAPPNIAETQATVQSERPKSSSFRKVLLAFLLCVLAVIIAGNLLRQPSVGSKGSLPSIMYVPEQQPVSSGSIMVAALGTTSIRIVVTFEMRQVKLSLLGFSVARWRSARIYASASSVHRSRDAATYKATGVV